MTQEWADQKNQEQEARIAGARNQLVNLIQHLPAANDEDKRGLMEWLENEEKSSYPCIGAGAYRVLKHMDDFDEFKKQRQVFEEYDKELLRRNMYSRFVDSEPRHFDGDIVITDPCYVIKHVDGRRNDWHECGYGSDMEALGITNYMTRDTIYGDWSCTTFNSDTKEAIGHFCADAGLVSVFLLEEIAAYNPDFEKHHLQNRDWTVTCIRDFKGDIRFVVELETGQYEEDSKWWNAGDTWEEYVVRVVGHGVNKVTGEPINFVTSQTGL